MSQLPAFAADQSHPLDSRLQEVIQSIGGATEATRFLTQFLAESWLTTTLLISNVAKDPIEAENMRQSLLNSLANPRHRFAVITLLGRLFAECTALHVSPSSLASSLVTASGASPAPSSPASTLRRDSSCSSAESPDSKKARKLPEDKFAFLNPAHENFWSYFITCSELREAEHAAEVCCPGCGTVLKSSNANNVWAHMTDKCKHKHDGALLAAAAANFVTPSMAPAAEIVTRFAALSLPVKTKLPEPWRVPLDQIVAIRSVQPAAGLQLAQGAALPAAAGVTPAAAAVGTVSSEEALPSPLMRGDGSFGSNVSADSLAQFLDPTMRVDGVTVDPQAVFRLGPDAHSRR
jgi:hypothetical protein